MKKHVSKFGRNQSSLVLAQDLLPVAAEEAVILQYHPFNDVRTLLGPFSYLQPAEVHHILRTIAEEALVQHYRPFKHPVSYGELP